MHTQAFYILSLFATVALVAGCAGPEQKLGRGLNNSVELIRLGEMRRSMEQAAVFDPSGHGGMTTGIINGIDRSFARTGIGFYEVLTFPVPNGAHHDYTGIFQPYDPVYPDSYKPDWIAEGFLQPDTSLGFAGGDIAPYIPGSRFRVFDN
jgi:putative exosortase-associated protein (TIGR04073 family)